MNFLQNNFYIIIVFAVIILFGILSFFMVSRSNKLRTREFLEKNPNASKVYIKSKNLFIISEVVEVYSVNEDTPIFFSEGFKKGFYIVPGQISVEMSHHRVRPGFFYRTVTTSTDVITKILDVKSNRSYILGFNKKESQFTFDEI